MDYIFRQLQRTVTASLARGKSILLLGPRQTGKTTMLQQFTPALSLSLLIPPIRQQYERNPNMLAAEIAALQKYATPTLPLVIVDEIQKVPVLLDVIQDLIDRQQAQFILTGSSARKLRHTTGTNWLPGRVVLLRLDPLQLGETPTELRILEDLLLYGSLPGIMTTPDRAARELDLYSYVSTYLEEEIRAEATVRNIGQFAQFLELAANDANEMINLTKLSQQIGVAHTTIASYYQILEDCLIAERIDPLTASKTRHRLVKSPKYLFFDLGIRRLCAGSGTALPAEYMGRLLEQWVGLELLRQLRFHLGRGKLHFWRDNNGPEVDWVIAYTNSYIPIEVKWTNNPQAKDYRHLQVFLDEYPQAKQGYLICRIPHAMQLTPKITALPWSSITTILDLS